MTRVKTSSRRPAILRQVSRISLNPPSKFFDNTSNKDHDHFHILSNSLSTHYLVLRYYRPIVSLLMASLMRCYNPSVRYSVIKPLNNSSFGYTYSQISWNVIIQHIIVQQSNIICPFYCIFETKFNKKNWPRSYTRTIPHRFCLLIQCSLHYTKMNRHEYWIAPTKQLRNKTNLLMSFESCHTSAYVQQ